MKNQLKIVQNVEVMRSNQNIKLAHQTRYAHKNVKIVCFKNVKSNKYNS
jgi:hypothetical protein